MKVIEYRRHAAGPVSSLDEQHRIIRAALANEHPDAEIVGSYSDVNVSGDNDGVELAAMIQRALDDPDIDAVVVADLTRLGRDRHRLLSLLDDLIENGVRLIVADNPSLAIDDIRDRMGGGTFGIISSTAEQMALEGSDE